MSQPYFRVGEQVILVSKDSPQLNGEHIVEDILRKGIQSNPFDGGAMVDVTSAFSYKLEGIEPSDTLYGTGYFVQETLRKKHKPSDESFSELMTNYTLSGAEVEK